MERRTVLKGMTGAALIPVVAGCTGSGSGSSSSTSAAASPGPDSTTTYSLDFDDSSPTTLTKTVDTGSGSVTVKYKFYANNVYSALYWDGGHAVNFDAPDLFAWIKKLTGYSAT